MRRFIYASRWSDAVTADTELALQQIVATSIQNNRVCDLTGFLVAFDGVFLQVLEGPDADIAETYGRITADPRHEALTVISDQPANDRAFRDWNMAGVRIDAGDPILAGMRGAAQGGFDPDAAWQLLQDIAAAEAEREHREAVGAGLTA